MTALDDLIAEKKAALARLKALKAAGAREDEIAEAHAEWRAVNGSVADHLCRNL